MPRTIVSAARRICAPWPCAWPSRCAAIAGLLPWRPCPPTSAASFTSPWPKARTSAPKALARGMRAAWSFRSSALADKEKKREFLCEMRKKLSHNFFLISHKNSLFFSLSASALERNDHAARIPLANAFGADVLAFGQGDVNDAALVGGHGLQGNRPAIAAHLLGHAQGQGAQILLAALTIVLGIHHDAHAVFGAMGDDQADQELEGGQRFAPATDQQAQVFVHAGNIQDQRALGANL